MKKEVIPGICLITLDTPFMYRSGKVNYCWSNCSSHTICICDSDLYDNNGIRNVVTINQTATSVYNCFTMKIDNCSSKEITVTYIRTCRGHGNTTPSTCTNGYVVLQPGEQLCKRQPNSSSGLEPMFIGTVVADIGCCPWLSICNVLSTGMCTITCCINDGYCNFHACFGASANFSSAYNPDSYTYDD